MARRTSPIALSVLVAMLAGVTGCTASEEPEADATAALPSVTSSATETPIPYVVPTEAPGEVARAVYEVVEGVDTTDTVVSDAFTGGDTLTVRGQCEGGQWMRYELRDTRPEGDGRTLTSGTFRCDAAAPQGNTYQARIDGTAQVVLTVEEGTERAWVTVGS